MELLNTKLPFFLDHAVGFRWGELEAKKSVEDVMEFIHEARGKLVATGR